MQDIISHYDYNESDPIYKKIRKEFTNKLKEKYQCEDYDIIVNYVFDYVFKQKATKSECIQKMGSIFNNKADIMIDYLWKITHEAENDNSDSDSYKRDSRKTKPSKYYRNKRDRSRSYSKERPPSSKFDFDNYNNYPPMMPKGFYPPPKGGFGGGMMPMGGAYPPYMRPPIIKR